ncbi:hypothetical protein AV530_006677 [Patagioenas fasciata monilis]|uniref:Uncharacterized protein n=1 Tax=Patagioenas fasciata monilis TaxID=372326 RepID=A0A1V4KPY5_PATFA|nr:hypothetical protein AV530_006677 [Patagioenas fasciata monilis]
MFPKGRHSSGQLQLLLQQGELQKRKAFGKYQPCDWNHIAMPRTELRAGDDPERDSGKRTCEQNPPKPIQTHSNPPKPILQPRHPG